MKACIPCRSSKIHIHIKAPLLQFGIHHRSLDHIHVDIVGPLIQWFHLLIHNSGSFVSPVGQKPFPAMTSPAPPVPKRLVSHWIARLGIPIDLSSDRGAQFTSQLWTSNDHYRLPPTIQWPSRKVPQTSEGSLTGSLALIGQLNYLGYFWEFVQHLRMT